MMKKSIFLYAQISGVCLAQISAGDVIAIDFGSVTAATANYNEIDGTGTQSVTDLIRFSDGSATGVGFTISGITNSTSNPNRSLQGEVPASSDPTIFQDFVLSNSGGSVLSMSFSGLSDTLEFGVFGGAALNLPTIESTWGVDGQTVTKLSEDGTNTYTYHSFDNVQTDGSGGLDISLSLAEESATANAVLLAELTLTAYSIDSTDLASANADALAAVTSEANALALANLQTDVDEAAQGVVIQNVETLISANDATFQNLETVEEYLAAVNAVNGSGVDLTTYLSSVELLSVNDMDLTDAITTAEAEAVAAYLVHESRVSVESSDITVDEDTIKAAVDTSAISVEAFTIDDVTLTDETSAIPLADLTTDQIAALDALGRFDSDGTLFEGVMPLSATQTLNTTSLSNIVGGVESVNSVTNLAFNGAHHRNLDSRLFDSETLEWATIDYEQQDGSTRQFYELGVGSRLGTESYAFGVSLGVSDQNSDIITSTGTGEIETRGFVVNTELNKSFLKEKLVVSGLFSFGVGSGSYNRDSSLSVTGGNGTIQYASITSDGTTLTSVPLYSLPSSFTLDESYSADLDSSYSAMRLRADYLLFENQDIALTPRVSYSTHQSSFDGYTEEGGIFPNTVSGYDVTNETLRLGADLDWFVTNKLDVRFFVEGIRNTVSGYDIEASNQFETVQLRVDELEDSYSRLGVELGWQFEGGLYGQFLFARTSQEVAKELFSINLSSEF